MKMIEDCLSDDEDNPIFISTQIQGRLDEIEEEEEKEKQSEVKSLMFQKYANKENDEPAVVRSNNATKKKGKLKDDCAKPRPKKKKKIISVTEQMIRKLSGKPQKLKQMIFNTGQNRPRDNQNLPLAIDDSFDDIRDYGSLFTERNWKKVTYKVLNSTIDRTKVDIPKDNFEYKRSSLWDMGNNAPELNASDWESLYDRNHCAPVVHVCDNTENDPPAILSQIFGSSQPTNNDNDDNDNASFYTISDDSSTEVIECSSDEGSLIQIHVDRNTSCDDSSESIRELQFEREVNLKREYPPQNNTNSTIEVIGSSDEEDDEESQNY